MLASVLDSVAAVPGHLAGLDPAWALVALAFHVANHVLRSVAWRTTLTAAYPEAPLPLRRVAAAYASGVALNAVAPARGGDAVKVGLMRASLPGSSVATIAATMSVLVLFDLVAATLLLTGAGLSGAVPLDVSAPAVGPVALAVGAGVLILLAAVVLLAGPRVRRAVRSLGARLREGGAILRTPGRYVRGVALVQLAAWTCRIGVVFCLLAAFGLPATVPSAALVMILAGASTLVPMTPGGMGTQQVLVTFALSNAASASAVLSFSLAMQAGITAVNALLGLVAAMVVCRTTRPVAAVRALLAGARPAGATA